jgi:arginyl-tRNA synthetase
MLTADLRRALLSAARDAGYPAQGDDPVLRPAGAPGRYTANLPRRIAAATGQDPATVAAALATHLRPPPPTSAVTPDPAGSLLISVTDDALERLAVRVTEAGPRCARSDALRGTVPARPHPPAAGPWAGAHTKVLLQVTAALAAAAGASVPDEFLKTSPPPGEPTVTWPDQVASATAFAGPEAIRYTLARTPPERSAPPDPAIAARHTEANPAYAVRYAYSCAASTLRWAADLGLSRGPAAEFRPGSLAHPRERALLDALSWLPEQVARAARRGRPHEFTAFLEELAETYQVCRVACPAWPERGHVVRARLWLTGAAAAGLAASLDLLGVSAPARL